MDETRKSSVYTLIYDSYPTIYIDTTFRNFRVSQYEHGKKKTSNSIYAIYLINENNIFNIHCKI